MDPNKNRRVYGVPVFGPGGDRPPTAPRQMVVDPSSAANQGTGPLGPAAATAGTTELQGPGQGLKASTSSVGRESAVTSSGSGLISGQQWKLRHVDFSPNLIRGKKEDEFERFPVLVDRANQWSTQNPQALVFSCETVTWSGIDRQIFTDSGLLQKSMHSDKKTRYLRGLRVWYVIYDETFFPTTNLPGPFKLGYLNYTQEGKNDNYQGLLAKINGDMFKKTVSGKILKVETLYQLSDVGDPDICGWPEQSDKNRDYVAFMRMFYVFKKDKEEDTKYGDIGIRDFIPQFNQRTPLNQGYEVYADLWRNAARWMYTNPSLHFINAQGLYVKVKKESNEKDAASGGTSPMWDRPNHREHASAYGSLSHQRTDYVQILRVIYHQPPTTGNSTVPSFGAKLFYKTFTPSQLRRVPVPGVQSSGSSQSEDAEIAGPAECTYEDLRQLEDKINAWLAYTGAKFHGVETIPTRLVTGGQEMLGPEATFVYNDREKNQGREYWRVNIRLYLEGEFKELPFYSTSSLGVMPNRSSMNGSISSLN